MKKIVLSAVFALFLAACGEGHHMSLNDKNGFDTSYNVSSKSLKIAGHDGPFALFFFSTTCKACEEQIPVLNELASEFKELKIIGVMGGSKGFDSDLEILKDKGVDFTTTSAPKSVSYLSNIVGGVMGTPVTYMFDAQGQLKKQFLGLYPKSAFIAELKQLL